MRKTFAATAAVLCLAFLAMIPAMATDLPATGMTRDQIVDWLKGRGYAAEIKIDSVSGDAYVASAANGVNFGIYFYECNAAVCPDMQYSTGWSGETSLTADKLNEWNRDKRYIRAYLRDSNVFGEYDVDLAPGGTYEQLNHSLDRWVEAMTAFKAFLGE